MPPFTALSFPNNNLINTLPAQSGLSVVNYGLGPQIQPPLDEFSESFRSGLGAQPSKSKLPTINYNQAANELFKKDPIEAYLNAIRDNRDVNIAFQDLVNTFVGQTFRTPGNINPNMMDYVNKFNIKLANAANELITQPNDRQKHNGANGFYGLLYQLATYISATPAQGGRKTARSRGRSRGRSGKKTRARKLKQRSRKRAVRRR